MGLGNKLIVSASGFPGTNKTLRFIQDAFKEPLGALAQMAGEKTIITGVVTAGNEVSNGFITYQGEIIPFQGGTIADTVTIIEEFENANYNIDANDDTILDSLPAYRTIYAMCGTGGIDIFNFSELTRLKTVKELSQFTLPKNLVSDANYVHTDNNFTVALLNKLNQLNYTENNLTAALLNKLNQLNYTDNNFTVALLNKLNQLNYTENNFTQALLNKLNQLNYTENNFTQALLNKLNQLNYTESNFTAVLLDKLSNIEYGAQKNVLPDWNNMANKPNVLTYLHKGNFYFTDFAGDKYHDITFNDVGTSNYMVVGSLVSEGTWDADNDVIWTVKYKTATSFRLILSEVRGDNQTLSLDYMLIPK
jgi:uncharacterized protein YukJ